MVKLKNQKKLFDNKNLQELLFKVKKADTILYSEEGSKFEIHKEFFCQTKFMENILFSADKTCCRNMEIFCPCSNKDLEYLVQFLYTGEIIFKNESDAPKILETLFKVFGFPEDMFFNDQKENFSDLKSDSFMSTDFLETENYVQSHGNVPFLPQYTLGRFR